MITTKKDDWIDTLVGNLKTWPHSDDFNNKTPQAKLSLLAETIGDTVYSADISNQETVKFKKSLEITLTKIPEDEIQRHEKDLIPWFINYLKNVYDGNDFILSILHSISIRLI